LNGFAPGGTYAYDFSRQQDWSWSVNHLIDGNMHTADWGSTNGRWVTNALTHETLHIFGIGDASGEDAFGNLLVPCVLQLMRIRQGIRNQEPAKVRDNIFFIFCVL